MSAAANTAGATRGFPKVKYAGRVMCFTKQKQGVKTMQCCGCCGVKKKATKKVAKKAVKKTAKAKKKAKK